MGNRFKAVILSVVAGVGVFSALYAASLYSYVLFHSLAELFSVAVAFAIFLIVWNCRRFMRNDFLLFIGLGYLFIGAFDLLHTLSYKGMSIFTGYGTNLATQLWVSARYVEAFTFLLAGLFITRKLRPSITVFIYGVVTGILLLTIFYWKSFPVCFSEGSGLTSFKVTSEYVICGILVAGIFILVSRRSYFRPRVFGWLTASITLTILSELAFTLYVHPYGLANLAGHYLKIASFYLIYKALVQTGLVEPHYGLFKDLKRSETNLTKSLDAARGRTTELRALLHASRDVLNYQDINDAGKSLMETAKNLTQASDGCILLSNKQHRGANDSASHHIFASDNICKDILDTELGTLCEKVQRTREALYNNDSGAKEGDSIRNALIVPLRPGGRIAGFFILVNKPDGFNRNDLRVMRVFGELTSVAVRNSETLKALKLERQKLLNILDSMTEKIYIVNQNRDIEYANPAMASEFGEIRGSKCYEYLEGGTRRCRDCRFEEILKGRTIRREWNSSKTGKTYDVIETPLKNLDGSISKLKISHDITKLKRIQQKLQKARDELEMRVRQRTRDLQQTVEQLRIEVRERRQAEKEIKGYQKELRSLSTALQLSEERERRQIAADLHDSVAQVLAFTVRELRDLEDSSPGCMSDSLEGVREHLEESVQQIRSLMFNLSPSTLYDLGLQVALEELAEQFSEGYGFNCLFHTGTEHVSVDEHVSTLLYRSTRELLINAAKYSRAEVVQINLLKEGENIKLILEDDGVGFDVSKLKRRLHKKRGFGIFNIRERLTYIGGSFDIQSVEGKGTKVTITAPLSVQESKI